MFAQLKPNGKLKMESGKFTRFIQYKMSSLREPSLWKRVEKSESSLKQKSRVQIFAPKTLIISAFYFYSGILPDFTNSKYVLKLFLK